MKLQSIVIGALAIVVVGQAATRCFEDRARRKEKIAAANALADASRTERFLRGQLQVATRYIHQGPIGRDRNTPRGTAVKVTVDVALEPDTARGAAPPQPAAFTGNALRFQSSWGNLDSNGVRVTAGGAAGWRLERAGLASLGREAGLPRRGRPRGFARRGLEHAPLRAAPVIVLLLLGLQQAPLQMRNARLGWRKQKRDAQADFA